MANFLTLHKPDNFEEQVRLFTSENDKVRVEEITNEDLQAAERMEVDDMLNQFFGFNGGIDQLVDTYKQDIEMLAEKSKDEVIKRTDLKANVEDPFHQKEYEQQKAVFTKRILEEKKEQVKGTLDHSQSTDYVKNETKYGSKTYYNNSSTRSGYNTSSSGYGTATSSSKAAPKPNEKANLNERVGVVAENVMDVAAKPIKGWRQTEQESGWGIGKRSWKQKVRSFFRTKKAKILIKTGMLMSLQLGMAMVGKKYEFEGMGQVGMFLGMMMGVFYLTRELAEDGFDPRGFGIL